MKPVLVILALALAFAAGVGVRDLQHQDRCLDAGGALTEAGLCRGIE